MVKGEALTFWLLITATLCVVTGMYMLTQEMKDDSLIEELQKHGTK